MSPMPQTTSKILMDELSSIIAHDLRNDFDVMKLRNKFKQLLDVDPVVAHSGLAIICAYIDKSERTAKNHYLQAIAYSKNDPVNIYNYSSGLRFLGNFEESRKQLKVALNNLHKEPKILGEIARDAFLLNAQDIFNDLLEKSKEFNIKTEVIHQIACVVALANADSEEEQIAILEQENFLGEPIQIDDATWKEISDLIDELS